MKILIFILILFGSNSYAQTSKTCLFKAVDISVYNLMNFKCIYDFQITFRSETDTITFSQDDNSCGVFEMDSIGWHELIVLKNGFMESRMIIQVLSTNYTEIKLFIVPSNCSKRIYQKMKRKFNKKYLKNIPQNESVLNVIGIYNIDKEMPSYFEEFTLKMTNLKKLNRLNPAE
jgi:hypothetical protein